MRCHSCLDSGLTADLQRLEFMLYHEAAHLLAVAHAMHAAGTEVHASEHPRVDGFRSGLRQTAVAARERAYGQRVGDVVGAERAAQRASTLMEVRRVYSRHNFI